MSNSTEQETLSQEEQKFLKLKEEQQKKYGNLSNVQDVSEQDKLNQFNFINRSAPSNKQAFWAMYINNNWPYKQYLDTINHFLLGNSDIKGTEISLNVKSTIAKMTINATNIFDEKRNYLTQDFLYNDEFKKQLLDPLILNFAQRNPLNQESTLTDDKSIKLLSGNNSLKIDGIEKDYLARIAEAIPKIKPIEYNYFTLMQKELYTTKKSNHVKTRKKDAGFVEGFMLIMIISIILSAVTIYVSLLNK